jgi:hypothetical protein
MPAIEELSGNSPADPWDSQNGSGQRARTDPRAGGVGNQDTQYFPPTDPRATASSDAEPSPPGGNATAPESGTRAARLLAPFQPWITAALSLAAVLFPAMLVVRSIRVGHTRQVRTASRSRRGQQVQSSAPMLLTGLLLQVPSRHDQAVDATYQGEPMKTRRAA